VTRAANSTSLLRDGATQTRECIAVRDMTDCLIEAYDCVARLAYQKFVARGAQSGGELEDWLTAEHEMLDNLSVDIADSGDCVSALASVPGLHGAQINIGIESRWLVIVGRKDVEDENVCRPEDDEKVAAFSKAIHSDAQTLRISAAAFASSPEFHARRSAAKSNSVAAASPSPNPPQQLFSILELPAEVDPSRAVAVLANGLLGLRMPKKNKAVQPIADSREDA
jgi:HSP20 family molecular chaperone IbpA